MTTETQSTREIEKMNCEEFRDYNELSYYHDQTHQIEIYCPEHVPDIDPDGSRKHCQSFGPLIDYIAEITTFNKASLLMLLLNITSFALSHHNLFYYSRNFKSSLFSIVLGKSGVGKTPILNYLLKPLVEIENETKSRLVRSNVTIETVPRLLNLNYDTQKRLFLASSEGTIFTSHSFTSNNDTAATNSTMLNALWDDGTLDYVRKMSDENFKHLGLGFNMLILSQFTSISKMLNNHTLQQNGFIPRFLFCTMIRDTMMPTHLDAKNEHYERYMQAIYNLYHQKPENYDFSQHSTLVETIKRKFEWLKSDTKLSDYDLFLSKAIIQVERIAYTLYKFSQVVEGAPQEIHGNIAQ